MKLTSRGFTLVELMIVIAIIGILAAALFPSMTNYLKRSRDAARASNLKDISTALGAYYSDTERYPAKVSGTTHCFGAGTPSFSGNTNYMPKGLPKDPVGARTTQNGCDGGNYGYSTGTINGSDGFQLAATFENEQGGITNTPVATLLVSPFITSSFTKGAGSGYIIFN
jgi:type IV pilus assembly protein PilE